MVMKRLVEKFNVKHVMELLSLDSPPDTPPPLPFGCSPVHRTGGQVAPTSIGEVPVVGERPRMQTI